MIECPGYEKIYQKGNDKAMADQFVRQTGFQCAGSSGLVDKTGAHSMAFALYKTAAMLYSLITAYPIGHSKSHLRWPKLISYPTTLFGGLLRQFAALFFRGKAEAHVKILCGMHMLPSNVRFEGSISFFVFLLPCRRQRSLSFSISCIQDQYAVGFSVRVAVSTRSVLTVKRSRRW
jgi:hypothetical protein